MFEKGKTTMYVSKAKFLLLSVVAAIGFSVLGAGSAYAYQGHMFAARDGLQQSLDQLQEAVPDKDGHRVNAINLVRQAIAEVNMGIQSGAQ